LKVVLRGTQYDTAHAALTATREDFRRTSSAHSQWPAAAAAAVAASKRERFRPAPAVHAAM